MSCESDKCETSKVLECDDAQYDITTVKIEKGDLDKFKEIFENVVFEGGGIRGIAFGGVIRFLTENELMPCIKRIAGSSAGAIVAGGLSIGYSGEEIIDILDKTDFNTFKDDSWGVVLDVYRFVSEYGIYKGDAFYEWYKKIVKDKTGDENITFKQVYENYGKELVITGTCLNRAQTYYFHHTTYPDMPIALAVRISMSIPLVFKAIQLKREEPVLNAEGGVEFDKDGNPQTKTYIDTMVDGGLLNNYPIWVFDGKYIGDPHITEDTMSKSKTLGFKLMSNQEEANYQLYNMYDKIDDIVDYFKAFIDSMTIQIERGHIRKGYWDKTVCINTDNIHSLDFSLDSKQKEELINNGYNAAKNHFYCQLQSIPNHWNTMFN